MICFYLMGNNCILYNIFQYTSASPPELNALNLVVGAVVR